jgi:hypothetical protein
VGTPLSRRARVTWVPQLHLYHRVRLTLCRRFPLVHCADFLPVCSSDLMADTETVPDRTQGRVLVIDGDIFYSPNSSRCIEAPPPISLSNIFNYPSVCLADFSQPRWWTSEFGWLSFLPLKPSFSEIPFDCLECIPYFCEVVDGDRYRFNSRVGARWSDLDFFLLHATSCLAKSIQVPAIRPFSPRAMSYQGAFKSDSATRRQARRSRDWFVVWIGMLSYLIAEFDIRKPPLPGTVPVWFEVLAGAGFDQGWLSGIYSSLNCSFSPDIPRAGAFIHIGEDGRCVQFFCKYHVPVWYPWGPKQEAWARKYPWLAMYAPLPEQFQAATTSLVRAPSPPPTPRVGAITLGGSATTSEGKTHQTWHKFFAARDERHAQKLMYESPEDCQRRLNRQRKPPTKNTKVFRWIVSLHGDPSKRVRTLITKKEHEDWFDYYGPKQIRYDAWENEWDLCTEFGDDDDDRDESDDCTMESIDPNLYDELPSPSHHYQRSPSPHLLTTDENDLPPAMAESSNFLQVLVQHYGFVPPLTAPPDTTRVDQNEWEKCMRAIGLRQVDGSISSSSLDKTVINFIHKITYAQRPGANEWDLDSENRCALVTTGRPRNICSVTSDIFLYTFPPNLTSFSWRLALTDAASILYVCRLDSNLDQYDVARCLLEQGITFRTLLPLRTISSSLQPPSLSSMIPIRLSQYKFTITDYVTYQQQRDIILASPRGRAALLRGGITWRLARDSLGYDGVLQGPSVTSTVYRNGFAVEYSPLEGQLWDDDLSTEELEVISGAYQCYTGSCQ